MLWLSRPHIPKPDLPSFSLARKKSNRQIPQTPPKKVSIVTQFYPPDYAATGQLIEELVNQLARLGMDIHIFTGQPGYAFQESAAPSVESSENIWIRRSRTSRSR